MKNYLKIIIFTSVIALTACDIPTRLENPSSTSTSIDTVQYYNNWSGHLSDYLQSLYEGLKSQGCESFIYYAGDSSLDNKHWIFDNKSKSDPKTYFDDSVTAAAVNGYEELLHPPRMVKDLNYWMNYYLSKNHNKKICSLMTSIEASTLQERQQELLKQDIFIQEHITNNDYLIVSVGGNDVAAYAKSLSNLDDIDENYIIDSQFFKDILPFYKEKTQDYIQRILQNKKPKAVIVSTLYYLDEEVKSDKNKNAWAKGILLRLSYDKQPQKFQRMLDLLYQFGTQKITIPGVNINPVQLSHALNGKDTNDYIQLVEPSAQGGKKMAQFFMKTLFNE